MNKEQNEFLERLDKVVNEYLGKEKFFLSEYNKENNAEFKDVIYERYQQVVFIVDCLETLRGITTDIMGFSEKHPVTFLNNEYRGETTE